MKHYMRAYRGNNPEDDPVADDIDALLDAQPPPTPDELALMHAEEAERRAASTYAWTCVAYQLIRHAWTTTGELPRIGAARLDWQDAHELAEQAEAHQDAVARYRLDLVRKRVHHHKTAPRLPIDRHVRHIVLLQEVHRWDRPPGMREACERLMGSRLPRPASANRQIALLLAQLASTLDRSD